MFYQASDSAMTNKWIVPLRGYLSKYRTLKTKDCANFVSVPLRGYLSKYSKLKAKAVGGKFPSPYGVISLNTPGLQKASIYAPILSPLRLKRIFPS